MNKRLKKKMNDREMKKKAAFVIKNKSGQYKIYVSKKLWNKGDKTNGYAMNNTTGDYITMDYLQELGFEFIGWIEGSSLSLELLKSWNNKNHLVKV